MLSTAHQDCSSITATFKYLCAQGFYWLTTKAKGVHPFPFRTRKLSPSAIWSVLTQSTARFIEWLVVLGKPGRC